VQSNSDDRMLGHVWPRRRCDMTANELYFGPDLYRIMSDILTDFVFE